MTCCLSSLQQLHQMILYLRQILGSTEIDLQYIRRCIFLISDFSHSMKRNGKLQVMVGSTLPLPYHIRASPVLMFYRHDLKLPLAQKA